MMTRAQVEAANSERARLSERPMREEGADRAKAIWLDMYARALADTALAWRAELDEAADMAERMVAMDTDRRRLVEAAIERTLSFVHVAGVTAEEQAQLANRVLAQFSSTPLPGDPKP